ncbi:hypothetical protein LZ31DRAFT_559871 [Colletotrichum somersetense]|nr:hypothetical protein LZ31DRAFT_559871 [Colletotrichum somersetense]
MGSWKRTKQAWQIWLHRQERSWLRVPLVTLPSALWALLAMGMLLSSGSRQHPVSLPTCPRMVVFGVSLSLGSIYLAPGTDSGVLGALLGAADLFGLPVMVLPSFGSLVIYLVRCEEYEGPERSKPPVMRLPGAGDHRGRRERERERERKQAFLRME